MQTPDICQSGIGKTPYVEALTYNPELKRKGTLSLYLHYQQERGHKVRRSGNGEEDNMATALAIAGVSTVGIEAFVPSARHTSSRPQWAANGRWGQRPADPLDAIATAAALERDQGNRISNLSEDFGEECVLPSGPLDLDAQGAL